MSVALHTEPGVDSCLLWLQVMISRLAIMVLALLPGIQVAHCDHDAYRESSDRFEACRSLLLSMTS